MKNKIIIGVVILVIIVAVFSSGVFTRTDQDVVKVGVILPLSGQYASFGEDVKKAMEISVNDLEHKNVELFFEDDQYASKTGLSAYNKLQSVDNVDMVIAVGSPTIEVIKPIINKSGEIMLTVGNEASIEKDAVYEVIAWATGLFKTLGTEVANKYTNIAVVYASDVQLFETNKNLFLEGVGDKKYVEVPVSSNSDMRTEVSKMLAGGADAYTLFLTTEQGIKFLNEVAKQVKQDKPQLICDANIELSIGDYLGKVLDKGVFEGCVSVMIANTTSEEFNKKYVEAYKSEPGILAVYGYDAVQLISKYLAGEDKSDWQKILENKKFKHAGMSGQITFDETGARVLESESKVFKDGKFVPVN